MGTAANTAASTPDANTTADGPAAASGQANTNTIADGPNRPANTTASDPDGSEDPDWSPHDWRLTSTSRRER